MRAIIVAAGRGDRLSPLTKETPKCLVKIFNEQCILGSQVCLFREGGMDEIVVVVGYYAERVEHYLASFTDIKITTIFNPFYGLSNSIVSCWLAREFMDEDFLIINGDTVVHDSVLRELQMVENDICLIVCEKHTYGKDDMKVVFDHKKKTITQVTKDLSPLNTRGESLGFFKFQNNSGLIYRETIERMFRQEQNLQAFHHTVIQKIIDTGVPVHYHVVADSLWNEVDCACDLESLRENVNLSFFDKPC